MDKKLNPLDGEIDLLGDTVSDIIRKLNPLTGRLELVYSADSYIQKINPFIGDFDMVGGTGASYIIKEVTGNGYINLTNAVANHLMELKAYGGTEQNGTPTPDTPVDIVSNNGVLKARHQSGLPIGYTLLDYIQSGGNNYIDTGIKLTNEDIIEMQYLQTADKGAIYGEYYNGTSNMSTTLYGNVTFYFYPYNAQGNAVSVGNYDANVHTVVHNFVDGYIDFDGVRTNFDLPNPNSFTNTLNCPIFGRSNGDSIGYFSKTQLYYFRIRRNGTLILDLIPAKDSDNNVGMYDRVSGTLFTESGSGSFTAGNAVSDPMTVYVDGTTETIWSHGKNLFNQTLFNTDVESTITYTTLEIPNGTYTMSTNFPVDNNVTNVFIFAGEVTSGAATATNGVYDGQSRTITVTNGKYTVAYRSTTSSSSNTNDPKDYNFQLELGSTATEYEPYYDGGTATAEKLLKIGDYTDEQEILSGDVTRKVGVKVLDGTEERGEKDGYGRVALAVSDLPAGDTTRKVAAYCTHFENLHNSEPIGNVVPGQFYVGNPKSFYFHILESNVAGFKTWLASQYAAGTPVIVVYPLAEPKTEIVTGQTMNIPSGNSTIEITQASIDNLGLYAKYKATE